MISGRESLATGREILLLWFIVTMLPTCRAGFELASSCHRLSSDRRGVARRNSPCVDLGFPLLSQVCTLLHSFSMALSLWWAAGGAGLVGGRSCDTGAHHNATQPGPQTMTGEQARASRREEPSTASVHVPNRDARQGPPAQAFPLVPHPHISRSKRFDPFKVPLRCDRAARWFEAATTALLLAVGWGCHAVGF
jgi:hypothetical protein